MPVFQKLENRSGSNFVQIISNERGKYKVVETAGSSNNEQEIQELIFAAKQKIERLNTQSKLFLSESDTIAEQIFEALGIASIRTVGSEIIFGKIYNNIGFNAIKEELFRHHLITCLAFFLSKLKKIEFLYLFQGIIPDIDVVYRFLDKLNNNLNEQVEQIACAHTHKALSGEISIVFYDITTLCFKANDADDLRKAGFSKD